MVSYDFSTVPAQGVFTPINGAGFRGGQLVLNDDAPNINAATYLSSQVWLDSFRVNFSFVLGNSVASQHRGGLAFVLQGDGLTKAGPNDAGIGYGSNPGSPDLGLLHSLAVEFDTFFDAGVDDTIPNCGTPHFAIHSMGAEANSAVEATSNFAKQCFSQITNPYSQGNMVHNVSIVYQRPYLSVFYDQVNGALLNVSYDLVGSLQLQSALAYIGFTASTGRNGGDRHAIVAMSYEYMSNLAPANCLVQNLSATQIAGELGTFSIVSFDEYLHPYPFCGANLTLSFADVTDPSRFNFVHFCVDGVYSITFNVTLASIDLLGVLINGVAVQGSPFPVTVTAGAVFPPLTNATGAITYAEAGQTFVAVMLVYDRYGNPSEGAASFANTTLSGSAGSINLGFPADTGVGQWSFTYTPVLTGHYFWDVWVNGEQLPVQPKPLFVSNGPPSAANSTVSGMSASFTVAEQQTMVLTVFDSSGNVFSENVTTSVSLTLGTLSGNVTLVSFGENGEYVYSYVLYAAGTWTPSVQVVGNAVTNGVPPTLAVLSGPPTPASSDIVYPGNSPIQLAAGTVLTTVLEARDQYSNLVSTNVGVAWTVTVNGVSYNPVPSLAVQGQFLVTWGPTMVNTYVMTALLNGVPVINSGSYQVAVSAGAPDGTKTAVSGSGATTARAGASTSFTVVVKDSYGNVVTSQVNVTVQISQGTTQAAVAVAFVTGGSYTVTYMCPSTGTYLLFLSVAGQLYGQGPQVINVEGALSPGAIAGIVLGSVAGVAVIVGVILLVRRKKRIYQPL